MNFSMEHAIKIMAIYACVRTFRKHTAADGILFGLVARKQLLAQNWQFVAVCCISLINRKINSINRISLA